MAAAHETANSGSKETAVMILNCKKASPPRSKDGEDHGA